MLYCYWGIVSGVKRRGGGEVETGCCRDTVQSAASIPSTSLRLCVGKLAIRICASLALPYPLLTTKPASASVFITGAEPSGVSMTMVVGSAMRIFTNGLYAPCFPKNEYIFPPSRPSPCGCAQYPARCTHRTLCRGDRCPAHWASPVSDALPRTRGARENCGSCRCSSPLPAGASLSRCTRHSR